MSTASPREPAWLLGGALLALGVSGIGPFDRLTWWLEVMPVVLGVPLLVVTRRSFPLTPLAYRLLFFHALVLVLGGHYTYARVPLGDWAREAFDLSRNHYDRIGHIVQGFVPAIVAREILLRLSPLQRGGWLFLLVTTTCLSISVLYEFIEWWAALIGDVAASAFLGAQGDVWDTHWDMLLALVGCLASLLLLGGRHDRELEALRRSSA